MVCTFNVGQSGFCCFEGGKLKLICQVQQDFSVNWDLELIGAGLGLGLGGFGTRGLGTGFDNTGQTDRWMDLFTSRAKDLLTGVVESFSNISSNLCHFKTRRMQSPRSTKVSG